MAVVCTLTNRLFSSFIKIFFSVFASFQGCFWRNQEDGAPMWTLRFIQRELWCIPALKSPNSTPTKTNPYVIDSQLTCLWLRHRVQGTSAPNRCPETPVWAAARREVCFCLTLVSSPLRFRGRGIGMGPAVWPSSPAARLQTHPAPGQAPRGRTTLRIW